MRPLLAVVLALGACSPSGDDDAATVCTDTTDDPYNCGECGHSCWGGTCVASQCQPVAIGGNRNELKDDLLVSAGGELVLAHPLHSYREVYATPDRLFATGSLVAVDPNNPVFGFGVGGDEVFFTTALGIHACGLRGCPDGPRTLMTTAWPQGAASPMAVTQGSIVFAPPEGLRETPTLSRCSTTSCASPEIIYTGTEFITDIRAADGMVVFIEGNVLRSCEVANCTGTLRVISDHARTPHGFGVTPPMFNIVDGYIVWVDYTEPAGQPESANVRVCPKADCTAPVDIYSRQQQLGRLTGLGIGEGSVWIGLLSAPGLLRAPLAGGPAEPVSFVTVKEGQQPDPRQVLGDIVITPDFLILGAYKVAR